MPNPRCFLCGGTGRTKGTGSQCCDCQQYDAIQTFNQHMLGGMTEERVREIVRDELIRAKVVADRRDDI